MRIRRLVVLVAGTLCASIAGRAEAGYIIVRHRPPPLNACELNLRNIEGATEGYDPGDSDYLDNPARPSWTIYSRVEGERLSTNSKPVDTLGFDFDLGVTDFVASSQDILRFQVSDATDLVAGQVKAWDRANPSVKYDIPLDGSYFSINLPDLVNQPAGEYAYWYLQLREEQQDNPIPEPAAFALIGCAAAPGLLFRSRKRA